MTSKEILKNIVFRCPFCGQTSLVEELANHKFDGDLTVKDVFDTLNQQQKDLLYYMVGLAVESKK